MQVQTSCLVTHKDMCIYIYLYNYAYAYYYGVWVGNLLIKFIYYITIRGTNEEAYA